MTPRYFRSASELRRWLGAHHADTDELWIGYYKKGARKSGITYREAVDEALCFGWIDGIGRRIDDERRSIRFTPRRPGSIWSTVNVAKVERLEAEGRMTDAGRAAFAGRRADRTGVYSFEQGDIVLDEEPLRSDPAAWAFWSAQPPSYQKIAAYWVTSAKRPETRAKRMAELVADSAAGLRIKSQRR